MATIVTLQPDSTGKDCRITNLAPTTNYVNDPYWAAGFRPANNDIMRYLIQFDLSSIPSTDRITSAIFSVYMIGTNENRTETQTNEIHYITQDWSESTVTWNTQPTFNSSSTTTGSVVGNTSGWLNFTITDLVQSWLNGTLSNYGLIIKTSNEATGCCNYGDSSDSSTTSQRPKLIITYESGIKKINGVYMGSQEIATTRFASDGNLQGYWKGENANDSSPNGYNLTNTGSVSFSSGKFGNGMVFNGSNYLSIANGSCPNLAMTGSRTFCAWIYPTTVTSGANYTIISKQGSANTYRGYSLYLNNGTVARFEVYPIGGATPSISSDAIISGNTWYFIAGVYDSANSLLKVYINDKCWQTSASSTSTDAGVSFKIGANETGGVNNYFYGTIDDVAAFDRALTHDELLSIYKTGVKKLNGTSNVPQELASTPLASDANLQGYWKLEANGNDSSPNGYNLTGTTRGAVAGKFGNGLDFEASNADHIEIATPANLNFSGSFTISAWINLETANLQGAVLSNWNVKGQYIFGTDGGCVYLIVKNNSNNNYDIKGNTTIPLSTWCHIVGVWDTSTNRLRVYLNGVSDKTEVTTSGTPMSENNYVVMGAQDFNGLYRCFDGIIDDVAVFNRALSATEISNLYNTNIKKYNQVSNV